MNFIGNGPSKSFGFHKVLRNTMFKMAKMIGNFFVVCRNQWNNKSQMHSFHRVEQTCFRFFEHDYSTILATINKKCGIVTLTYRIPDWNWASLVNLCACKRYRTNSVYLTWKYNCSINIKRVRFIKEHFHLRIECVILIAHIRALNRIAQRVALRCSWRALQLHRIPSVIIRAKPVNTGVR